MISGGELIFSDLFQGIYLVDDVYFPQDTLVLNKFQLSDSSTREKLMVEFRNDSMYLSNYNFNGWYGKWFCNFHTAQSSFDGAVLKLDAQVRDPFRCKEDANWRRIEYLLIETTEKSLRFAKIVDTTNCPSKSVTRFLRSGGGGDSSVHIRSDIQLR